MTPYAAPLQEIRFVLTHVVDLAALADIDRFAHAGVEDTMTVLEEAARLVENEIAPLNQVGDRQGSVRREDGTVRTPDGFVDAYRSFVEAGWAGVPFPEAYGGGEFPWVVGTVIQEMLNAANESFAMAPILTHGAIDLLLAHGDESQRERFLPKLVSGEWTATMNLSEPQAGSDVGALRTRAEPAEDGTWRITGTKVWISWGEHDLTDNIVHLVLARVPDAPPGTRGISCFIVPKHIVCEDGSLGEPNAVVCQSIEHKLGIKASPTCVLDYEGASAELVGEPNAGMRYMFKMMNNARLSVGLQGLAVGERAYQAARAYAREREQGQAPGAERGKQSPIVEHPDVRRMLLDTKAKLEALRCLIYLNGEAIDRSQHDPDEAARRSWGELTDLLIPVSKAWGTDLGVDIASTALQVFGGMGYVEETGVAQLYRDARIAPIYEGTNGIQAMDLVGRKLPMRDGGVVEDFLDRIRQTVDELDGAGFSELRSSLADGVEALAEASDWILRKGSQDQRHALAAATPYLEMFGTVTGGWLLARSALAARQLLDSGDLDGFDPEFLQTKVVTARFYVTQLLPRARGLLGAVTAGHEDLTTLAPSQF